jgi:hypothetical protein
MLSIRRPRAALALPAQPRVPFFVPLPRFPRSYPFARSQASDAAFMTAFLSADLVDVAALPALPAAPGLPLARRLPRASAAQQGPLGARRGGAAGGGLPRDAGWFGGGGCIRAGELLGGAEGHAGLAGSAGCHDAELVNGTNGV